uniref:NADH-ubiquinone oxidoreductase chain 2 n=1 Tax=Lumbriclymenella robusta TaxID=3138170 RepID=A0AB38ZG14_9ANNE
MPNLKVSSYLFICTLIMGTFMAIFANNWLTVWIGLEINLYSFLPLMSGSSNSQQKEGMMKYFLVQSVGSGILWLGIFSSLGSNLGSFIILTALLLKAGVAPFHFWFPGVMCSMPWAGCLLLTTTQKIPPILLISEMYNPTMTSLWGICALTALVGGIGGLNQTQLRAILAYSSIGHMGWIIAASLMSTMVSKLMLMAYMVSVSSIIGMMMIVQITMNSEMSMYSSTTPAYKITMCFLLLSLGGLPPLFGFFPKLMVLMELSEGNFIKLSLCLIMGSVLNLYYYLKILYGSFFSTFNKTLLKNKMMKPHYKLMTWMLFIFSLILSMIFVLPWLML